MRTLLRAMGRFQWLLLACCMVSAPVFPEEIPLEQTQAWLREGRHAELDAAYNALQRRFQQQPEVDEWVTRSFTNFSELTLTPEVIEPALDAWVNAFPRSYASHAARGIYYVNKGLDARGARYARDTSEVQFEAMRHWFDLGRRDLLTSLDLSPKPVASHSWLMTMAMTAGEKANLWRHFHAAVAYAPSNISLHYTAIESLTPRWGGDLEVMERFAAEREQVVGPGLTTNMLWGTVWYERISPLMKKGDYAQVDQQLSQALVKYGSRRLYCARARARVELDRFDDAMQDMMAALKGMSQHDYCARVAVYMAGKKVDHPGLLVMLNGMIAANPDNVNLRRYRGWMRTRKGDHAAAREDLQFAADSGDAWSQAMVARYHLKGLANTPVDAGRAVELFRASASKGDMHAQQSMAQVLKSMGRLDEAEFEFLRYRVSEAARPRLAPAERVGVSTDGPARHLLDPRVQAVALAALVMLWIFGRTRRR